MQARLKVLHDKANVKQVKLLPVTLIGRSTECNLKIASSQVSRNHCRITVAADAVYVEDLGSANGTLIDGQPLTAHQPTAIAPGTHLIVGPAEFQIDFVAPSSPTLVLSRNSGPVAPELPATEMIYPVASPNTNSPVAEQSQAASAPVAQPMVAAVVPPLPEVAAAVPVEVAAVAAAPLTAEWQPPVDAAPPIAAAPVVTAPVSVEPAVVAPVVESAASAVAPDTEILDPNALAFGAEEDEEAGQATQFMFAETIPDSIPFEASSATKPEAAAKKGGLKSLFSLFGRKDKATGSSHQASVAPSDATASPGVASPSVFLPTMETQPFSEAFAPEAASLEQAEAEVVSSTETAEFVAEQAPPTSTEENDDFQQFLSQF